MKLQLISLSFKNFGPCGNEPICFDFENIDNLLLIGKNGSGKSNFLIEPLFYCFFGESFRNKTNNRN